MLKKKRSLILILLTIVFITAVFYFCNNKIANASRGKVYSAVENIPYNKVGLLLGTGKYIRGDRLNPYYSYRIDAAIKLIRAGKIKYLIISGDNSRKEYDEPTMMRSDLINAGIDSSILFLDYAGFRTFDSIIRAKEIFGQTSITIISQPFHNARAIYIATSEQMSAIGFNAKDVRNSAGWKVQLREKFARVKVFVDKILGKKPKFLGQTVKIPD